ncbi:hypothetical protein HKD37_17G048514 [Glycine soja]
MHRAIRIFQSSPKASASALTLSTLFVERKDIDLIDEEEAQIGGDRSSATSNKAEIYNEEARKKTQKHKPKRVESVNADAEAFAEALEHTKKRDTGHQSVALDNETGVSTMLKMGDSAKVVIKQDMKGREHKYGFNNNEREKPEKKRVVDDEIGDKHELDEVLKRQIETKNRCLNKRKM